MKALYVILALLALILLYIVFLWICALFVSPKKEYEKNSRFYRWLLNSSTAVGLKIMRIKVSVNGIEKIPKDTRVLVVSNHRSNFDPIITWYVLRHITPAFISKPENFKVPIFGRFIRKCCFMAIDRQDPRQSMKTILKATSLIKKDEVSIGVYPEGTRSKSGELLEFHNGVFKIAQKANVPIVVMTVVGTEKIHKNYPLHSSTVHFDVIDVLMPDTFNDLKTDEIGSIVYGMMENQIKNYN